MKPQALQQYLFASVPLTQHMQIEVQSCDNSLLQLSAPLTPNANHHGTAFGGSIASIGVLCGWCMMHIRTEHAQLSSDLVVQKASIEYSKAIRGDITARCTGPTDEAWTRFVQQLETRGKGRLMLEVEVLNGDEVAASLQASYAASLKQ